MNRATLVLATTAALATAGCSDMSRQQTFIATGAAVGAAVGATVTGAPGIVTGVLVGAAAGGAGGYVAEKIWRPATPR